MRDAGLRQAPSSSTGLVETPAFKNSTPEEVADAVVDALEFARFDVFVPKSIGPTWALFNLVPRRAREAVARALKLDRALLDADRAARAAYEARAAASAPATEAVIAERRQSASRLRPSRRSSRSSSGSSSSASRGGGDVDRVGLAHPGDHVQHLEPVEHELERERLAASSGSRGRRRTPSPSCGASSCASPRGCARTSRRW